MKLQLKQCFQLDMLGNNCKNCNKWFKYYKSDKEKSQKFCSRVCHKEFKKGNK